MKFVVTILLVLITSYKSNDLFKYVNTGETSAGYSNMKQLYNEIMTGYEASGDAIYGYCNSNAIVNQKISEYNTLMIVYPKYCDATTDLPCEIYVAEDCKYKI